MKLKTIIYLILVFTICSFGSNSFAQDASFENLIAGFGNLENFGYNFFRQDSSNNFSETGPINPDYRVRTGDEVVIDVWGDLDFHYVLPISIDGYIDIPNVRRVFLNGNTFVESKQKIIRALGSVYSSSINTLNAGTGRSIVDVSLGKVSGVTVYISGEARNPGIITAKASDASIIQILRRAGGVFARGSLRNITVRKIDGRTLNFDFYDFLLKGEISAEYKYLDDEDIVFIPLKKRSVALRGAVRRPARYELLENENLLNLIDFAGGFIPTSHTTSIQIIRTNTNKGREILDIDIIEDNFNIPLQNGDRVIIATTPQTKIENIVRIQGEGIKRPGVYQFEPGMRIKDLIDKAGGFHSDILLERADLVRKKEDLQTEILQFSFEDALNGRNDANFPLNPMDVIYTYSEYSVQGGAKSVTVEGHVKRPGQFNLHENLNLYDLLFLTGGFDDPLFRKETYLERADIIRFDEITQVNQIIPFNLENLLNNPGQENIELQGGDIIRIYQYDQITPREYVYLYGEINNSGKFELRENMNLHDLISLAGGFTDLSLEERIDLSRIISINEMGESSRSVLSLDYTENTTKSFMLESEDIITIRKDPDKLNRKFVQVTGQVNFPDTYVLFGEERIMSLLDRAGGLKNGAFIEGVRFFRSNVRLSIELKKAISEPESEWNLLLISNDSLHVPVRDYSISIEGEVFFPKRIQYKKGEKAGYYIQLAGGYNKNADKGSVKIITPSGTILKTRRFLPDLEVPYGSRIVIPAKQIPEKKES